MPSIAYYTAAFPPVCLTPKTTTAANEGVAWGLGGGVLESGEGVGGSCRSEIASVISTCIVWDTMSDVY